MADPPTDDVARMSVVLTSATADAASRLAARHGALVAFGADHAREILDARRDALRDVRLVARQSELERLADVPGGATDPGPELSDQSLRKLAANVLRQQAAADAALAEVPKRPEVDDDALARFEEATEEAQSAADRHARRVHLVRGLAIASVGAGLMLTGSGQASAVAALVPMGVIVAPAVPLLSRTRSELTASRVAMGDVLNRYDVESPEHLREIVDRYHVYEERQVAADEAGKAADEATAAWREVAGDVAPSDVETLIARRRETGPPSAAAERVRQLLAGSTREALAADAAQAAERLTDDRRAALARRPVVVRLAPGDIDRDDDVPSWWPELERGSEDGPLAIVTDDPRSQAWPARQIRWEPADSAAGPFS